MLLLIISAETPLKRIKITCNLFKKALTVLFFGKSVAVINYDDEREKQDLNTIISIITPPKK
ncbi:hypothetical protein [Morganella morganii]|uniref:hypothetical protein n=1 Tax=Morganella TaxID=581 RepID=UPI00303B0768|nr:hypothetical protein [Morganella morganii]